MAYNLPLQINLQPPTQGQLNNIRKTIESSLGSMNVGTIDTKNFVKTNAAIQTTSKTLDKGQKSAEKFWDTLEGRTRSGIAFTIVSTALLKISGSISQATRESIKYETELLKISQVTGDTVERTNKYSKSLDQVSKKYNVTLSKVALLTRTLTQTGLSFKEAAKGAEILARTSLLATFDSLTSTTEGLIAVMQTFEVSVSRAGKVLESINAVSKQFAVESSDIVEAIRRTGGAFSTAGGQIEELIALFTAVRSTSRESAETIATGFRTIFGRLQRPKTIEFFKELGIQLETAEGQFIGPYQAIEEISKGLERLGIAAGSTKFAQVVEQIGGIRQISRVVPLLQQAAKSQKALDIANSGSVESIKDVEKAQQGLGYQLGALQKEFNVFISDIINSPSFKFLAEVFINTSKAVLRLVSSLKPLLPILASVAAFKIGRGLSKLLSGGFSLKGAKESLGFATGGMVPGSGNGDTVPAMLTPGEFVIRKSAVQAFGADRLASINKYAAGGLVSISKVKEQPGGNDIEKYQAINNKVNDIDSIKSNFKRQVIGGTFNEKTGSFIPYQGFSSKLDWKKIVDSVAGYKGNVFTKWAEAFEEEVGKATGMSVTSQSRNDVSYPIDLEGAGKLAEVRMRQSETAYETYLSKIFRAKIDQNSSDLNKFTKLANESPDEVGLQNFEVYETSPEGKKEFLKWASHLGHQAKAQKKIQGRMKLSQEALQDLQRYTLSLSFGLNSQLADPSNESYATRNYEREIKNLDSLMVFDLPSMLHSGFSNKKYEIIKKKIDSLSPDPRNPDFNLLKGEVLSFPGFLSSSTDYDLAKSFGSDMSGGVMNIKTKGKGVDVVQALTNAGLTTELTGTEKEFILPRNSKFKVINISKNPKGLLSYFLDVQQLATGGKPKGTGTDTVPALLTPGEFVINKKSAQSFGYDKLHEINKYADGGFVDGLEVQKFNKGGLSKAEKKRLRREKEARDSDSVLTKGEQTGGVLKGIVAKYEKLYKEEKTQLQEYYQQKANNAIKEGKSVKAVLDEYNAAVADLKKGVQTAGRKEVSDKKADIVKKLMDALKPVETETTSFAKRIKNGAESIDKSMSKLNISFAEVVVGSQSLLSGLKNFAGLSVNQEALTKSQAKGGLIAFAGEAVASTGNRKNVTIAGKALESFGSKIPKVGGKLSKFGTSLVKNAGTISSAAKSIAKGLNILAAFEVVGGFVDSLLSTDYESQKEKFIALGDSANAGEAAMKAYNQEFLRGIPIIGSFIAGIASYFDILPRGLDDTGKLIVANAKLAANTEGLSKRMTAAQRRFSEGAASGDLGVQKEAIQTQLGLLNQANDARNEATSQINKQKQSSGSAGSFFSAVGGGAVSGGLAGAAVGGLAATPFGAIPGAIGGAIIGGVGAGIANIYSQITTSGEEIIKGYEYIGESIKASAESQAGLMSSFGDQLTSEVQKVIRAGGTYEDALGNLTEIYGGEEAVKSLFGGEDLASADPKELRGRSDAIQREIELIKKSQISLDSSSDAREIAEKEAEIKKLEGEQVILDKIIEVNIATKAAALQEERLAKERLIAAKAIEQEIKLRKNFQSSVDNANQSLRNLDNAAEEIGNIGSGKLTFRQAAQKTNLGVDPKVLEMSTDEILRNTEALAQMGTSVEKFAGAGAGGVIKNLQTNFDRLEQISSQDFLKNINLKTFEQGEGSSSEAQQIQQRILDNLNGYVKNSDPIFESAVLNFAKNIQSGIENAGEAEQKAREEVSKLASEFIDNNKKILEDIVNKEQQYRELEIELANKRIAQAQAVYDIESDMFNKRMSLLTNVEDFLNPIQEGPGQAAQIAARGRDRASIERIGLNARRGESFQRSGFGGANLNQAVQSFIQNANNAGAAFEQIKGQSEVLLQTIQDEIDIEQKYLDSLMESTSAQQSYTQSLNDAQGSLVRDLVTGTDADVKQQLKTMNAAGIAAQQGSFAGIPEDMKKDIFGLFDQFGNVEIPGLGMTGRDAQKEITKNEMMRKFGVDEATATQLASKAVNDNLPIDQKMAEAIEDQKQKMLELFNTEEAVKTRLLNDEDMNIQKFGVAVNDFRTHIDKLISQVSGGQNMPPLNNAPQVNGLNVNGMIPNNNNNNGNALAVNNLGSGNNQQEPIQIQAQGQQEITIRLPDIQALANQAITSMVYEKVGSIFNKAAEDVRTADDFNAVANALQNAATSTENMSSQTATV